jgi:hypothetical protein
MTVSDFINLQKRLGLNIISTGEYAWVITNDNKAVSTPSLEYSFPTKKELSKLFSSGVRVASFVTDMDEKNSYEYVFQGDDYSIETFKSKIRNQIRKGLKSCEIKKPTHLDLNEYALGINQEILSKHGRDVDYLTNATKWSQYSKELLETKDVFTYGAYINDVLVAYVFFIKVNNKYYVYHPYASRKYSKEAPMNALLFVAVNDFIKNDGEVVVSYGLASIFEKKGLDHFKKGMQFVEIPVTRVMAFSPMIELLLNNVFLHMFEWMTMIKKFNILKN